MSQHKPAPSASGIDDTKNTINNGTPTHEQEAQTPKSWEKPGDTSSTPTPLPPPKTQAQPNGNPCNTFPAWSPSSPYTGGSKVVYQQNVWSASWWTYGDVPGGVAGVWTLEKSCS